MIGDYHFNRLSSFKSLLSVLVTPIQYSVNIPAKTIGVVADYFTSRHNLLNENARLKEQNLLLETQIQQLNSLENENGQLRELLNAAKTQPYNNDKVSVAQILTINSNPFDQEIVLDKGKNDGVYLGQPVVDADGLVGQIITVDSLTSRALLISSVRSAVPIENTRNNVRAIATGEGSSDTLSLLYVPNTVDIQVGDLFTTSGLGMKFPKGYFVGKVISVDHPTNDRFAVIKLTPSAKFNTISQVLLIWPKSVPNKQNKESSAKYEK
jgi:rod shape-determining protein MreC